MLDMLVIDCDDDIWRFVPTGENTGYWHCCTEDCADYEDLGEIALTYGPLRHFLETAKPA